MSSGFYKLSVLVVLAFIFGEVSLFAVGSTVEIWTRKAGSYQHYDVKKQRLRVVNLKEQTLQTKRLIDLQYAKPFYYEGLYLKSLLELYSASKKEDMVILHFANKTLIPLSLDEVGQYFGDKVFIAIRYKDGKRWRNDFPKSKKMHFMHKSPLPITFAGNKVVVPSGKHPNITWTGRKDFSPWQFVGSLVGVEFVQRQAYEKQFHVSTSLKSLNGNKVFLKRCQYCHGVNRLGADFGWDVNGPIPLYKKRNPESLKIHVKYPKVKGSYFDTGMPNQRDFTKKEAFDLWFWLRDAAQKKMQPYKPN